MQMNHSASFWKVRNQYAEELRGLWSKNYTGDGFWGRGKTVLSEQYENTGPALPEVMPRSLCGGTFKSRGRKRKRRTDRPDTKTLTYAERQQKRIAKKFGTNGFALGDDEETKIKLEHGVKVRAKPRVAGSVRGRELRAAAAAARLRQQKEEEITKVSPDPETGSETEDDYQTTDREDEALDLNGSPMLDGKGNGMVKICEDEDRNNANVKQERQELQDLHAVETRFAPPSKPTQPEAFVSCAETAGQGKIRATSKPTNTEKETSPLTLERTTSRDQDGSTEIRFPETVIPNVITCAICSMENGQAAVTCAVCSHVIDTNRVHKYWRCHSSTCQNSKYINAADCALCGVCGAQQQNNQDHGMKSETRSLTDH